MERGVVRSSARLSGGNGNGNGSGSSNGHGSGAGAEAAAAAARRAAAAAAAARRALAAERAREVEDSPRALRDKCRRLARAVRKAKHLVVYTGAGISTAADIPDYRGPRGVWTRLRRGEPVGRVELARARPTFTHMALAALVARGRAKFVVSQNCDGLHARAGLPRRALAELHGDMFAERCAAPRCRRVLLRAFDTTQRTARHAHLTRRLCPAPRCGRPLRDTIVHFGERARAAWPLNWAGALRHAAAADVILCLGSSLKVLRRYPALWSMARPPRARPELYIVNLQWTPKDATAALKINARCDDVLRQLARRLRLRVPRYSPRRDPLLAHATPLAPAEAHTCDRPALPPPPAGRSSSSSSSASASASASASSSSGDSEPSDADDALPLRRLQERLRAAAPAPAPPPPPAAPPSPPPAPADELRSFEVVLSSGAATILLRARHAPPAPPAPPAPAPAPARKRHEDEGGGADARLRHLLHYGPRLPPARRRRVRKDDDDDHRGVHDIKDEIKHNLKNEFKDELEEELCDETTDSEEEEEAAAEAEAERAAAAFTARAVLVCRAQLYPGLHTILAAPAPAPPPAPAPAPAPCPPPAPPAECDWCAQRFGARRCLWYPRLDPLAPGRVWRRVRGRRYLCTCCPDGGGGGGGGDGDGDDGGEGGWYGKGYRKGRRRRR